MENPCLKLFGEASAGHPLFKLAANQRTSDPTNFGITPRNGRCCTGTLAFHYIAGQSEAEDAGNNRDRRAQPRPPKAGSRFLQCLRASLWLAVEWKAAVPARRPRCFADVSWMLRGCFADFRRFSRIFADFRGFSTIFADFRRISRIFADVRRISQIFMGFH